MRLSPTATLLLVTLTASACVGGPAPYCEETSAVALCAPAVATADASEIRSFAVCGDRWAVQCGGGVFARGEAVCIDGTVFCGDRGDAHCVEVVCDGTLHVGPGGEP